MEKEEEDQEEEDNVGDARRGDDELSTSAARGEAQAAVADADDDLARRVAQVELDAKAAEVAAPALATMDGSLHALPSKPAPGLDDMDGSLYNLRAFG